MASLRRSKILSPDSPTAQFLYTIIKQLDLKTVDWNEVASGLDITNGHAARMRFSRLKAQIEGLPTQLTKPRAPRPKKDVSTTGKGKEKSKPGYEPGKVDSLRGADDDGDVKMEQESRSSAKKEGNIKIKIEQEIPMREMPLDQTVTADAPMVKPEPGNFLETCAGENSLVAIKQEPPRESHQVLTPTTGIAAMDLNSYPTPPPTPTVKTPSYTSTSPLPTIAFSQQPPIPAMPPHATVSLADLQLPPIPKPSYQMPLPTFSYPLTPMGFSFDFKAPMEYQKYLSNGQPQFDIFEPVSIKSERMEA